MTWDSYKWQNIADKFEVYAAMKTLYIYISRTKVMSLTMNQEFYFTASLGGSGDKRCRLYR